MKKYIAIFIMCLCSVVLYGCGYYVSAENADAPKTTDTTYDSNEISGDPDILTTPEETVQTAETTTAPIFDEKIELSSEDDGTAPGTVNISEISSSCGKVTISWEKTQCSGYIIAFQDNDVWRRAKDIGDGNTTECTVEGLADSTLYRFKIYAYNIDSDGTKKLGQASDAASVMTPDSSGKRSVTTSAAKSTVTTTAVPEEEPEIEKTYGGYVIIGDSRIVGMSQANGVKSSKENVKFIAKNSMGFKWFSSDALASLDKYLEENSDSYYKIVITMGVNDVWNIDKYITCYNGLISKYESHELYFLSVNPVIDHSYFSCTNSTIDSFNQKLKDAFPDRYIDTATRLKDFGFETPDGLHYGASTNVSIFNWIIEGTEDQ